jgi:8-oxo-dGTP pyrophosphatase MutT (NUDIX family)
MTEPQPAATVMVARESNDGIEVFMLRRSSHSAFMPDVFVFPGGRVDPADSAPEALRRLAGTRGAVEPAHVFAAARETFEECGLLFAIPPLDFPAVSAARERLLARTLTFVELLEATGTFVDGDALRYFSRWITPPLETRRFDTHFFVARAPAGQAAQADAMETHDGIWIRPGDALDRAAAGTFRIIFPTIKHLERLREFDSIDALLAYTSEKTIAPVMPDVGDGRRLTIPPLLEGVW